MRSEQQLLNAYKYSRCTAVEFISTLSAARVLQFRPSLVLNLRGSKGKQADGAVIQHKLGLLLRCVQMFA